MWDSNSLSHSHTGKQCRLRTSLSNLNVRKPRYGGGGFRVVSGGPFLVLIPGRTLTLPLQLVLSTRHEVNLEGGGMNEETQESERTWDDLTYTFYKIIK